MNEINPTNEKNMTEHLNRILLEKMITPDVLAGKLGISVADLRKRLNGVYRFDINEIQQMIKIIGMKFGELFPDGYEFNVGEKQKKHRLSPNRNYSIGTKQLEQLRKLMKKLHRSKASLIQEAVANLVENFESMEVIDEIDDVLIYNLTLMPEDLLSKLENLSSEKGRSRSNLVRVALHEMLKSESWKL